MTDFDQIHKLRVYRTDEELAYIHLTESLDRLDQELQQTMKICNLKVIDNRYFAYMNEIYKGIFTLTKHAWGVLTEISEGNKQNEEM